VIFVEINCLDFVMRKLITALMPPVIVNFGKSIYYFFLRERTYSIDGCEVLLPPQHRLDLIQKRVKTYDMFLPILSEHLDKEKYVIDVGANIGDSAIPFLKKGIKTICVEPSEYFFSYLKKNLASNGFEKNTVLIKKFVSNSTTKINLFIKDGTASTLMHQSDTEAVEDVSSFVTLDNLLEVNGANVSLVKVDTDGFDFDVILSGINGLRENEPILFFENMITQKNVKDYQQAYKALESIGYDKIAIFDNLGNIILDNSTWGNVISLNRYTLGRDAIPFYYTDIVCCTARNSALVQRSLEQFNTRYNSQNIVG